MIDKRKHFTSFQVDVDPEDLNFLLNQPSISKEIAECAVHLSLRRAFDSFLSNAKYAHFWVVQRKSFRAATLCVGKCDAFIPGWEIVDPKWIDSNAAMGELQKQAQELKLGYIEEVAPIDPEAFKNLNPSLHRAAMAYLGNQQIKDRS